MTRTRGGRKVTVHAEYDPDDMIAEAHCHLCQWQTKGAVGEDFYVQVRTHALKHKDKAGTTGNRPPAIKKAL